MSWRITKPYRFVEHKIKWFKSNTKAWKTFALISRPRKKIKYLLVNLKSYINKKPKLKRKFLQILDHMPTLRQRLQRMGGMNTHQVLKDQLLQSEADLSPKAKNIHQQLINCSISFHSKNKFQRLSIWLIDMQELLEQLITKNNKGLKK